MRLTDRKGKASPYSLLDTGRFDLSFYLSIKSDGRRLVPDLCFRRYGF